MSECVTPTEFGGRNIHGNMIQTAQATIDIQAAPKYSTACLDYKLGTKILPGVGTEGRRGQAWACGWCCNTGFTTILPPNSIGCEGGIYDQSRYPPDSNHPGGVNGLMADGSVRFISDTIDGGTPAHAYPTGNDVSPFGVWGAMGSKSGGEAKQ